MHVGLLHTAIGIERPLTKLLAELYTTVVNNYAEHNIKNSIFSHNFIWNPRNISQNCSWKIHLSRPNNLLPIRIIFIWFRSFYDLTCKFRFNHPSFLDVSQILNSIGRTAPHCSLVPLVDLFSFLGHFHDCSQIQFSFFPISCLYCLLWFKSCDKSSALFTTSWRLYFLNNM